MQGLTLEHANNMKEKENNTKSSGKGERCKPPKRYLELKKNVCSIIDTDRFLRQRTKM